MIQNIIFGIMLYIFSGFVCMIAVVVSENSHSSSSMIVDNVFADLRNDWTYFLVIIFWPIVLGLFLLKLLTSGLIQLFYIILK